MQTPRLAHTIPLTAASATPPADPTARQAVSQVASAVLVSLLLVVLTTSVLILLALRRRSRVRATKPVTDRPADAWAESARRVGLEEHPDIPREPGTE